MKSEKIINATQEAEELVKDVSENYRREAFQVVLSQILSNDDADSKTEPEQSTNKGKQTVEDSDRKSMMEEILSTEIDYSAYSQILQNGSWSERAIAVMLTLEKELGIRALTAPELAQIFKEQINLPHVHRQNIYRELSGNTLYFIKSREGKGHKYSPTMVAKSHLNDLA